MKLFTPLFILFALVQSILGFVHPPCLQLSSGQQLLVGTSTTASTLPTNSWMATQQQQQQQQQHGRVVVVGGRQSVASVRMQGLFGLGFAEIAVILVVVAAVLGPETLGRLVRTSADRATAIKDELEKVPEEFQKGMEEGESNVRARKARVIKVIKDDEENNNNDA